MWKTSFPSGPFDLADNQLNGRGNRHREQRTGHTEQRTADQDRHHNGGGRNVDLAAHHPRIEPVGLEQVLGKVEQSRLGSGLTARDVRTGDRLDVSDISATAELSVSERFVARIVPVGTQHEIFGGLEMLPLRYFQPAVTLLDARAGGR